MYRDDDDGDRKANKQAKAGLKKEIDDFHDQAVSLNFFIVRQYARDDHW